MADRDRFDARYEPADRTLRAADHDREAVAEILRTEHVSGRLSTDELQERLERALAAKTYQDLDALVADFPVEEEAHRAPLPRGRVPFGLVPLLVLVAVLLATGGHAFWLAVPVFFFVVRPLLWRTAWGRGGGSGCGARFAARPGARW